MYYKYRVDQNNTIVAKSTVAFTGLTINEAQVSSAILIPEIQPLYLYRVTGGTTVVENTNTFITSYLATQTTHDPYQYVLLGLYTGYTGTTVPTTYLTKSAFSSYTGNSTNISVSVNSPYKYSSTIGGTPASKTFRLNNANTNLATSISISNTNNNGVDMSVILNSLKTGARIYLQNLSNANEAILYTLTSNATNNGTYVSAGVILTSSGVSSTFSNNSVFGLLYNEAIGDYVTRSSFIGYTGTTAPATYQSKSSIATLTGTTLPATYQSKTSINTYTGITAPGQFQSKSSIVTLTGTTLPATYLTKSAFNAYTGSSVNILSANNGLTKSGTNVRLGGSLTGNTTITTATGSRLTVAGWPLMYATDLSGNYSIRSLVDRGYVTGITSSLLTISAFNTYSGNTANLINTKLATSAFNTYSANTANLINTKIGTANNGLTKSGTNVRLGGPLTGATTIGLNVNSLTFTGTTGTLRYGSDLSANYTPRSLVDKGYVTGNTQPIITFKENGTNLNTPPTKFTTINFTSGTTAIDKGSGILEVQTIYGSEVFNTGKTTTSTNATATFVDYIAHGFILAGGTYKVEYVCKATIGTANTNLGIQLLIDGVALESGTNNLYRVPNVNARITVSLFKIINLSAGSHSFRLQFSASSGTATAEYGWILITRIS